MSLLKYLPVFCFHHEETVYPQDFDLYLPCCQMISEGKTRNINTCCVIPNTPVTIGCYPSSNRVPQKKTISGNVVVLNITSDTKPIEGLGKDCYLDYNGPHKWSLRPETPLYGYVRKTGETTELWYQIFYPYQLPYSISVCGLSIYVGGEHQADLETVKVVLDSNDEIESVVYYQHGNSVTVPKSELLFIEGRPLVYVAKISHASYPESGTYHRLGGFANDYTSILEDGKIWKPTKVVDLDVMDDDRFIKWYRGNLGNNGVTSFRNRM